MKAIDAATMRRIDRRTIEEFGVPGETLMERAGQGVAALVVELAEQTGRTGQPVRLYAGKGNNGGDAFVAARRLAARDWPVEVWLAGEAARVSGDAALHLERMLGAGVPLRQLPDQGAWQALARERRGDRPGLVVDGLLGTGSSGAPRGAAAAAIGNLADESEDALVVAIDIPSGLDADTGATPGTTVRADVTAAMAFPKRGLLAPGAVEFVGRVEVVDIGVPAELREAVSADLELITAEDVRAALPRRARASHKGSYGHVLVAGGATGYAGAAALAVQAALRSGAGLVSALVPGPVAPVVAGLAPEAMVHPARSTEIGSLAANCLQIWDRSLSDFDAVLLGPGMTRHPAGRTVIEAALAARHPALVLDADALNLCAGERLRAAGVSAPVLTPHPGEMARLLGCPAADVQRDRFAAARRAAREAGATVVLKGAGTVIAAPEGPLRVNLSGNPGMACGGMGDVLGGLLAGLRAQGLPAVPAACAAVYLHGSAGDLAARGLSQAALKAGDVLAALPPAWVRLTAR